MGYNFKCGLCKNIKENHLKTKIVFWTQNDLQSDTWCNICLYKIINVCKASKMNKDLKQKLMNDFNVEIL